MKRKKSEVDGEVGESLDVRMRRGDHDETNKAQTCATVWSFMCARNCATDEDNTNQKEETLHTN